MKFCEISTLVLKNICERLLLIEMKVQLTSFNSTFDGSLKSYIFVVVLLVEGFVQVALRKELAICFRRAF